MQDAEQTLGAAPCCHRSDAAEKGCSHQVLAAAKLSPAYQNEASSFGSVTCVTAIRHSLDCGTGAYPVLQKKQSHVHERTWVTDDDEIPPPFFFFIIFWVCRKEKL